MSAITIKKLQRQAAKYRLLKIPLAILLIVVLHLAGACTVYEEQATVINAEKPLINYFIADASTIESGKATNLKWNVANAERVEIQPDIGIVPASGNLTIYPGKNIQYSLTARNSAGVSSCTLNISVIKPAPKSNCSILKCDPVSGRNQDISFKWEQLCLCTEYRLQIAKDADFTMIVYDRNNYVPSNITSPGLIYLAGGILNCGQTYYIRVQCIATATGQRIFTPWSATRCITIEAGLPVTNPYQ